MHDWDNIIIIILLLAFLLFWVSYAIIKIVRNRHSILRDLKIQGTFWEVTGRILWLLLSTAVWGIVLAFIAQSNSTAVFVNISKTAVLLLIVYFVVFPEFNGKKPKTEQEIFLLKANVIIGEFEANHQIYNQFILSGGYECFRNRLKCEINNIDAREDDDLRCAWRCGDSRGFTYLAVIEFGEETIPSWYYKDDLNYSVRQLVNMRATGSFYKKYPELFKDILPENVANAIYSEKAQSGTEAKI